MSDGPATEIGRASHWRVEDPESGPATSVVGDKF